MPKGNPMGLEGESLLLLLLPVLTQAVAPELVALMVALIDEKMVSWVFIISLAYFGEEIMTVEISPSWRCIKGPYILAKSVNFQCGVDVTSRCTFPIIGRFHGPGGMFRDGLVFISFLPSFSTTIMERKKGKIIRANELSI